MIRFLFIFYSLFSYAQENNFKDWSHQKDNHRDSSKVVSIGELKNTYLNKRVKPIEIEKKLREYYYKKFYSDKKLKKKVRNRKAKGYRQHSSNGAFGTLVYYRGNSNYDILNKKTFVVKKITPIRKMKSLENSDDGNFIFELYNSKLGSIYYKYNPKYENHLEIKLVE